MAVMSDDEIREFLEGRSAAAAEIVLALREMVLGEAPGVSEGVRFGALAYFWAGAEFGSIGGNVCLIEPPREDRAPARSRRRDIGKGLYQGGARDAPPGPSGAASLAQRA